MRRGEKDQRGKHSSITRCALILFRPPAYILAKGVDVRQRIGGLVSEVDLRGLKRGGSRDRPLGEGRPKYHEKRKD